MSVPEPSTIVWHDYKTDPPNPPNGYFLLITRPIVLDETRLVGAAEASRWDGEGWRFTDGDVEIDEDDILYWAAMPEVRLPEAKP